MNWKSIMHYSVLHLYTRRRFFTISAIVMMTGMILLSNTFMAYFHSIREIIEMRMFLGEKTENIHMLYSTFVTFNFDYYEGYKSYLMEAEDKYDLGIYKENILCREIENEDSVKEIVEIYRENGVDEMMLDITDGYMDWQCFQMNNSFLRNMQFKDRDGNILQLGTDEFGRHEVAVGSAIAKEFPIGTEIEEPVTRKKAVVKYILEDGQYWGESVMYGRNVKLLPLDYCLILPLVLSDMDILEVMCLDRQIYLFGRGNQVENDVQELKDIAKQHGVFFDIESFSEYEKSYLYENNDIYKFSVLLAIIMIVAVCVILCILTIISWVADYHDLGILYANGFMDKDILSIIMVENGISLLVAMLGGVGLRAFWMSFFIYYNQNISWYSILIYTMIFLLYLVVMSVSSIVAYKMIRRMNPSNLLRGERV